MKQLNEVISKNMVFLNQEFRDMKSILNFLITEAKNTQLISNEETFLKAVLEREKETSTIIGYEIAMPHGKSNSVIEPFISYLHLSEKIQWSSEDDELIDMVFLIGVPNEKQSTIHLKFISELSKSLLDDEFRANLHDAKNKNEAFSILDTVNKKIAKK